MMKEKKLVEIKGIKEIIIGLLMMEHQEIHGYSLEVLQDRKLMKEREKYLESLENLKM